MSKNLWNIIWNERGESYPEDDPIKLGGWDQGFGMITKNNLDYLVNDINNKLELDREDIFLELGCGGGMLLSKLSKYVKESIGTDLSVEMVKRANKIFPWLSIIHTESIDMPFEDKKFTKILVHSVMQYFPNIDYCEKVIDELLRVTNNGAIILLADIMDEDKKIKYLDFRKKYLKGKELWKSSVTDEVTHLYYSKGFFKNIASIHDLDIKIFDRDIPGYLNSKFRFDVLLRK